jgi:membrane fusion protein (multidrug efflux system)
MKSKIVIAVVIVLVVAGGLAGVKVLQIRTLIAAGKSFVQPPETISSAVAQAEKWTDSLTAVGSISAVQGVMVAPEVAGTVTEIDFESGATVAQGDLLVRLDTSSEEAQLRADEAQAELAKLNLERARKLRGTDTISQSDLDSAEAALKQTEADADGVRAVIAKKTIRAPFAGKLGIRQVNLGESLDVGKGIVSLQALSPAFADFSLPQQDLARLRTGLPAKVTTDTYPDKVFDGVLAAINPDLDTDTRNVRLRVALTNGEQLLRPGMFVRVELVFPEAQPVLAIPATAVLSAPFGDSVYVIEPATNSAGGLVVRQQFVRLGRARGDFVSVTSGLKAGDRIVSAGAFKLRNGSPVVENNELAPKPSNTPHPADS